MNEKYYTPKIEEFHVGFECESNYCLINRKSSLDGGNEFIQFFFTEDNIDYMLDAYKNDAYPTEFRVKYLDEKDIESLGFKEDTYNGVKCFTKNNCQIFYFAPETHIISIDCFSNDYRQTYFKGLIKNKSELKRILKMIGHGC